MSSRNLSNVPQSVHDRLLNQAREGGFSFNELLLYYGIERFLYRLSRTKHAENFALKGALILRAENAELARSTRDIDLLDLQGRSKQKIREVVRDAMDVNVEADGMEYDPDTIRIEEIRPKTKGGGLRINFRGFLGTARVPMQIDIGVGDVVLGGPIWIEYPELLDYGQPRLLGYPLETVIAEKFEAIVDLGTANTRMKDFYDVWLLCRRKAFGGPQLQDALRATFEQRKTPLPTDQPEALTDTFIEVRGKQKQWASFLEKTRLNFSPSLSEALSDLREFLLPPARAAARDEPFNEKWSEGGPWHP